MEIRQLRALVAIAETHTFTAAAGRVHVTQAAISMQIRQLELETGTLLFVRTPRRCVLTHAGERLLERARRILREHNDALPAGSPRVGFYGLDLYSPRTSMEAVVSHLLEDDPGAAQRARERYACFDQFGRNPRVYATQTGLAHAEPCERQVVAQLVELRERSAGFATPHDPTDADARFFAEQNARLVVSVERYYRELFRGGPQSWNLRERHMADTLDELVAHLERGGETAKVVVWAHNSHVGDARATETDHVGELNLGQLLRERHGADVLLVGLTTFAGTVLAASDWGEPAERMGLLPALPGSWEELLHERGAARLLIASDELDGERLQRAVGVIYRPELELISHYLRARIAGQFDAVIHIDDTQALTPLG